MSEWADTIDSLIAYLRYRQECGERSIELDPGVLAGLSGRATNGTEEKMKPAPPPTVMPAAKAPAKAVEVPPSPREDTRKAVGDSPVEREAGLKSVAAAVAACERCDLCRTRGQTVPGQGNGCSPEVMFVGEAPGEDEDAQGLAFVGAAGQLLTRMIQAMGFTREQVFIANICKCRPPHNRQPTPAEMQSCLPFLRAQLAIIRPRTIVALGGVATKGLLDTTVGITRLRGQWTRYGEIPLMPTFHPSFLLRYPAAKKNSWDDLKAVLKHLGREAPARPAEPARAAPPPPVEG